MLEPRGPAACDLLPLGYVWDFAGLEFTRRLSRPGWVGASFPRAGDGDVGYSFRIGLLGPIVDRVGCYGQRHCGLDVIALVTQIEMVILGNLRARLRPEGLGVLTSTFGVYTSICRVK